LHDQATALKAVGDERGIDALMCETLVARVTGTARAADRRTEIALVMTDATLLGLDDKPAHLIGAGPVTAQLAREIASGESVSLRRLFTDPVDATATQLETKRRFVDGPLRRLVKLVDQTCRGPQCARPIRDVDHAIDWATSRQTSFDATQGLSEGCHVSRDHPGMRLGVDTANRMTVWHTPSGLAFRSMAPPALGHGSATPAQRRNRRWLKHPPSSGVERHLISQLFEHTRSRARGDPPANDDGLRWSMTGC
jgi:hypothetical protein